MLYSSVKNKVAYADAELEKKVRMRVLDLRALGMSYTAIANIIAKRMERGETI